jgi:hypothetical protein
MHVVLSAKLAAMSDNSADLVQCGIDRAASHRTHCLIIP